MGYRECYYDWGFDSPFESLLLVSMCSSTQITIVDREHFRSLPSMLFLNCYYTSTFPGPAPRYNANG